MSGRTVGATKELAEVRAWRGDLRHETVADVMMSLETGRHFRYCGQGTGNAALTPYPTYSIHRLPAKGRKLLIIFHGLSAFPITPADEQGIVDADAVSRLTARLADAGVDSIGLLGSTGTYAYLTRIQRRRALEAAVESVGGKTPLIIGVGAMRTDDAQELARDAEGEGADALLLAPVSYTPLTDDEVFEHYAAIANSTGLPLCIYNNPSTTHFTFSRSLVGRLSEVPNIAAIKMPVPGAVPVATELHDLRTGPVGRLAIGYSGDWGAAEALLAGADAWYSVVAGFLPGIAMKMVRAARAGDRQQVREIDSRLQPLWNSFREFGSLRVAYTAFVEMGLTEAKPPKPILPLSEANRRRVLDALDSLGMAHEV